MNDKITNIVKLTEERIKQLTMQDLKEILAAITETEAKTMVKAIRESKWELAANMIELITYRTMQKKATEDL